MKQFIFTCFTISLSYVGFSQVDKTTIDGKEYFIYPFQTEISQTHKQYLDVLDSLEVITRDERNRKIISSEMKFIDKKSEFYFNLKSNEEYFNEYDYYEMEYGEKHKNKRAREKKRLKNLKEQFDYETGYLVYSSSVAEPTPMLETIPDGDYVMFYRDIPYKMGKSIHFKNDVKAAIFQVKNNLIEGTATYFNEKGEAVAIYTYNSGLKNGSSQEFVYEANYEFSNYNTETKEYEEIYDTTIIASTFSNGVLNGLYSVKKNGKFMLKGEYLDGDQTGTWETYQFKQVLDTIYEVRKRKDQLRVLITPPKRGKYEMRVYGSDTEELILQEKYTLTKRSEPAKGKIIRGQSIFRFPYNEKPDTIYILNNQYFTGGSEIYGEMNEYDSYDYNMPNGFNEFDLFKEKTENLDLPEESMGSYEMYEYERSDEGMYFSNIYGTENSIPNETYLNGANNKRYTLNEFIDSLGYYSKYDGIHERYYSNGQLMYKTETIDGAIQAESPIYWENGTVANEVKYNPISEEYAQYFYDYNGALYKTIMHDKKGNVLKEKEGTRKSNTLEIDGLNYGKNTETHTFYFSDYPAMKDSVLADTVLMVKELYKPYKNIGSEIKYDSRNRIVSTKQKNITGATSKIETASFNKDFSSINIENNVFYRNLRIQTIASGEYMENRYMMMYTQIKEIVPLHARAYNYASNFQWIGQENIYVDNKLFTGTFVATNNTNAFKFKANDSKISMSFPQTKKDDKLFKKEINRFRKDSSYTSPYLEAITVELGSSSDIPHQVPALFSNLIYSYFGRSSYDNKIYPFDTIKESYKIRNSDFNGDYNYSELAPKMNDMLAKTLTGMFTNGMENGLWTVKNVNGKALETANFVDGQLNGQNLEYAFAYPKRKSKKKKGEFDYDYNYEFNMLEKLNLLPSKKTYYLASSHNYSKNRESGPSYNFNFKGDTTYYAFYRDGDKEGKSFERNPFFYSVSNYSFGEIDGISRTYFLPPGKDSILLSEINFQEGRLQGESRSFHPNGKIAKRGFFLSGEPIDDYEAYDTLGVKYQYVKFQFGQAVEEKIWEANQLSVKYEFDWRDSLEFRLNDLVEVPSVDRLLSDYGYEMDYNNPYMGRPSLLDKSNADYAITKYYPNDTIARTGFVSAGKKVACWKYYSYEGEKLCEAEYFDSILVVNDSTKFKSKGILTYVDKSGNELSKSWIIEKVEKYDCSHTDHNEERMLWCFWQKDTAQHRINGYVKNYYDNGSLQNEGMVKNGLPTGIWKMYDPNGNLNQVGAYVNGKRNGRWLKGDLGSVKNMSEVCLNPNMENLEAVLKYQENLLDISVIYYQFGKEKSRQYYGINQNNEDAPDGYYGDEYMEQGW